MPIRHPTIVEGQDPFVLGAYGLRPNNPSGFDGWNAHDKQLLIDTMHKEVDAIARDTGEDLSTLVPTNIPLYIKPKNIAPTHASMTGYQTLTSHRQIDAGGVLREKVITKTPAKLFAVALGLVPSDMPQIDKHRLGIRHELIHTLLMNSAEIYEMLTEGLTEYLTESGVPNSKRWAGDWNVERFQGTCGLRSDDNTQIVLMGAPQEKEFVHSLTRILAMNAFRLVTRDQVWAICKSLDSHTKSGGVYPTFDVFETHVRTFLPLKEANALLKQPLFQPMRPGEQSFLLPQQSPVKKVRAHSMYVHPNPSFQAVNPQTNTSEYRQYGLEHRPSLLKYSVKTKSGAGGKLQVMNNDPMEVSQPQMSQLLGRQNITVRPKDITLIDVDLRGLKQSIRG